MREEALARFKALHAFNSLCEFNCSRATFNALWAFNSALHVQKFFQSPTADILQITFKIKQGNGCVSKVLQTKTVREVVNDKLVCRYNSLSARGCFKHPIIFTSVKLCSKFCIILRSIATTISSIGQP